MAGSKSRKRLFHEKAFDLLELDTEIISKTQARRNFLWLLSDLNVHPRTVEITDHDNQVAVLLSYNHYVALISQLSKLTMTTPKTKPNLMGTVIITGNLEVASKRIGEEFRDAIKQSAANP